MIKVYIWRCYNPVAEEMTLKEFEEKVNNGEFDFSCNLQIQFFVA